MSQTDDKIHHQEIRASVGVESVEPSAPKPQVEKPKEGQDTYQVIAFLGKNIPKQYKNLIYSKWLRTLRYGNDYFKLIDSHSYYSVYERYIAHTLDKPTVVVRFAVLSIDQDVVLGFSVSQENTLHYVYTHKDNRRQGIARSLVPFTVKTITHLTKTGLTLWNSKAPEAIFNPFA